MNYGDTKSELCFAYSVVDVGHARLESNSSLFLHIRWRFRQMALSRNVASRAPLNSCLINNNAHSMQPYYTEDLIISLTLKS